MATGTLLRPKPTDDRPEALSRLEGFDGLRGVAVLAVVAFHVAVMATRGADWAGEGPPPMALWPLFAGKLGVDIFFVLSGFLVLRSWRQIQDERPLASSLAAFASRRARRILPAFWLCLVLLIPLRTPEWLVSVDGLKRILMFASLQQFLDPQLPHQLNVVTWSLTTEIHFYLLLPLLAFALVRLRASNLLVVSVAVSIAWRLLTGGTGEEAEWIFGRVDQFVAGMAAFSLLTSPRTRLQSFLLSRSGAVALSAASVAVALPLGALQLVPKPLAFLSTFHAAAGLVIAGWLVRTACRQRFRVLSNRALVGVGHASYSLYLWHWPLLIEATVRWGQTVPAIAGALVATALISAASYVLVEKPFMHRRSARPTHPREPAAARGM